MVTWWVPALAFRITAVLTVVSQSLFYKPAAGVSNVSGKEYTGFFLDEKCLSGKPVGQIKPLPSFFGRSGFCRHPYLLSGEPNNM